MKENKLVRKRINDLVLESSKRPERSKKYYEIIHKLSQKTKTPITQKVRKLFCSNCKIFKNNSSLKTRIKNKKSKETCLKCGFIELKN